MAIVDAFFSVAAKISQKQLTGKDGSPVGTQLTLNNAAASDSGKYSCVAANTHGQVTSDVQLKVAQGSISKRGIELAGRMVESLYATRCARRYTSTPRRARSTEVSSFVHILFT